jgi:putative nucleotidyltransferase with HDIG domain
MRRNSEKRNGSHTEPSLGRWEHPCHRGPLHQLLEPYISSQPAEAARADAESALSDTEAILFALAVAVEQRDRHTAGHCERLALLAVTLGIALGLSRRNLLALYRGGYLHDIGKVGIPDSILFKPEKLTAEEWVVMRSHTTRGEEICRPMKSLSRVLPIIRHHHERWDGSGYPDGLRGEQIPLLARVLQVVDIYDALTMARAYKPAFSPARALDILKQETDRGWRDPQIVSLFARLHDDVLSRIAAYATAEDTEHQLASMRQSLANLQVYLASAEVPPGVTVS